MVFPLIAGILLCRSWRNLIDNYGKLNTAKFKVINRMEIDLPVQAFSAEWVALGKGVRKEKYRSFTQTEKAVPLVFGAILLALVVYVVAIFFFNLPNVEDLIFDYLYFSYPP